MQKHESNDKFWGICKRCVACLCFTWSPVWLFATVAPDMIVVVAWSSKALAAHVTRVRFLTWSKEDNANRWVNVPVFTQTSMFHILVLILCTHRQHCRLPILESNPNYSETSKLVYIGKLGLSISSEIIYSMQRRSAERNMILWKSVFFHHMYFVAHSISRPFNLTGLAGQYSCRRTSSQLSSSFWSLLLGSSPLPRSHLKSGRCLIWMMSQLKSGWPSLPLLLRQICQLRVTHSPVTMSW